MKRMIFNILNLLFMLLVVTAISFWFPRAAIASTLFLQFVILIIIGTKNSKNNGKTS